MLELSRRFQETRPGGFGGPAGPGGGPRGGVGPFPPFLPAQAGLNAAMLLRQSAIKHDLKVAADQAKELREWLDKPTPPPPPRDSPPGAETPHADRQPERAQLD